MRECVFPNIKCENSCAIYTEKAQNSNFNGMFYTFLVVFTQCNFLWEYSVELHPYYRSFHYKTLKNLSAFNNGLLDLLKSKLLCSF